MIDINRVDCAVYTTCLIFGVFAGFKLKKPFRIIANTIFKEPTKLVLVVREDLKMGKGKVVAQCCHGTLLSYKNACNVNPKVLEQWELSGSPKVVVKVKNLEEFNKVKQDASSLGVSTCIVIDAGRTQVEPGTMTVMAVGPDLITVIDKITSHLKLL